MHVWDDEENAIWYETHIPDDITDLLLLDDGNEESDMTMLKVRIILAMTMMMSFSS